MTQDLIRTNNYKKMNVAKHFKTIYKRCYQWLFICRKNIMKFKIIYAI